jgi:very-short-patch-repair endonuclease
MLHQHENRKFYLGVRALARKMRKNPTEAEAFFWEKVRDRRLFGLKWNRQFIIQCRLSPFIVKFYISDFHCCRYKLIVELDGQIHLLQEAEDMLRTDRMGEWGYTVLRFTNDQVLHHWDEVEGVLRAYIFG